MHVEVVVVVNDLSISCWLLNRNLIYYGLDEKEYSRPYPP